jgi:general secretion pathway protein G
MIKARYSSGFTLIELIIVISLIGVIFAFIAPRITKYLGQSKQAEIKFKFAGIKEALTEYKMTFDVYPSNREGLRALVENPKPHDERYKRNADKWPFIKEESIMDKAGNEFEYHCPPEKFKGKYKYFELIYLGSTQSEDDPERMDDGV